MMKNFDPKTRAQLLIAALGTLTALLYAVPAFAPLLLRH